MKKLYTITILFVIFISTFSVSKSQDLRVFGFTQFYYAAEVIEESNVASADKDFNSFRLQQFNLMASSNLGKGFNLFVNLEYTNNYDFLKNWGNSRIQEVYLNYSNINGTFNFKFGQFLPRFNYLYELYNRMPLLPTIWRPMVYEPVFQSLFSIEDFVPETAFLQFYGTLPMSNTTTFDYAAYIGNSEKSFSKNNDETVSAPGTNFTTKLAYGTRVGIEYSSLKAGNLKLGVSFALDHDKKSGMDLNGDGTVDHIGDPMRNKLGIDFGYQNWGFNIQAELINVMYNLSDKEQENLDKLNPASIGLGSELDKLFYYFLLQYYFMEDWSVYAQYSFINDKFFPMISEGMKGYDFGVTYAPIQTVVFKAQVNRFEVMENDFGVVYKDFFPMLGVAVSF